MSTFLLPKCLPLNICCHIKYLKHFGTKRRVTQKRKVRGAGDGMKLDTKKFIRKLFKLCFRRERVRINRKNLKYIRNETRIIKVFGPF